MADRTDRARTLRRQATAAETRLWQRLRARQVAEAKFVRQYPIGPYFADFCCRAARLVVEVDGGQHSEAADTSRTRAIEAAGYVVLRFWNDDVLTNTDGVLAEIERTIRLARNR